MSKYKFVIGFIVVSTVLMVVLENYAIMEGLMTDTDTGTDDESQQQEQTETTEDDTGEGAELEPDPTAAGGGSDPIIDDPAADADADPAADADAAAAQKEDGMSMGKIGMIIGGVVGGLLVVGLVGYGIHRYMKKKSISDPTPTPD
jgi:hypothetical protein